ncbi:MAG: polyprenyl synthetase family protein [Candidatus Micrarchaeota archaeon]|nr:polyprenyl synthetase family protein [Candidatus Micrarchaeota archaeon]
MGFGISKEGSAYALQLERQARTGRRFLFSASLPLASSVRRGVDLVSEKISRFSDADFSETELFAPVSYALRKPGKMLRPALVMLGAELIGSDPDEFVDMAAAAELLHTASLVHDDIIDNDTARRGAPSLHARYGPEAALLSGDALIAKAVGLAARYGADVMETVSRASLDMCAGELLDFQARREGGPVNVRKYLKIARLKNAVFMGTCASLAARFRHSRKEAWLYGFGLSIGVAFQIRDDLIEVIDSSERLRNGGSALADAPSNMVDVFARQFGVDKKTAIRRAAQLNNYFADRALGFVKSKSDREELEACAEFVRVSVG